MDEQEWVLKGHVAQWRTPHVTASVDLLRPGMGFGTIQVREQSWGETTLFGVEVPGLGEAVAEGQIADAFVRKSELGVTYAMAATSQLHSQLAWRSLRSGESVGVHWILSLRTPRLDARPLVRLHHRLAGGSGEVVRLGHECLTTGVWHPPIVLYRPTSSQFSLVQTAYPSDLLGYALESATEAAATTVTWEMLDEHLEKGVIRRVQAAVWWVSREDDESEARRLYDTFVASPPPLD